MNGFVGAWTCVRLSTWIKIEFGLTMWSNWEADGILMEKIRQLLQNRWIFLVIVALGLDMRMGAAMLGHNFDMD